MTRRPLLIAVMGPTASGKTGLAEAVADEFGAQLINADAFQVYRGLDIGTNKPAERHRYELLDVKDPDEAFGVGEFVQRCTALLQRLFGQGRDAILVGGTGLYIRAITEQWRDLAPAPDPAIRARVVALEAKEGLAAVYRELQRVSGRDRPVADPANPVRVRRALERALSGPERIEVRLPAFRVLKVAVAVEPAELNRRIEARTDLLLRSGWIEEVQALRERGVERDAPGMRAIGYRTVLDWIESRGELADVRHEVALRTRQYAKRQRSWLRTEPNLHYISDDGLDMQVGSIQSLLLRSLEGIDEAEHGEDH